MSFQLLTTPSSIGRVLDSGFKLFTSSFKSVLGLVILSALVSVILQYAMFVAITPEQAYTTMEQNQEHIIQAMPVLIVVGIVVWLSSIAIYNMILVRVGQFAFNEGGDVTDAILKGMKKLLPVFLAIILYIIAIMLGFILLIIPGLILFVTLLFFQILIVTEDAGIIESLKKSHRLVWGNYWRTAIIITIPIFIIYALVIVVALISGVVMAVSAPEMIEKPIFDMNFGLVEIVSAALPAFLMSLLYSVYIVQVNDLKLRKSGADLQQRL